MARKCVTKQNSDFFEGVRAILIDKDQSPKWNPSNLQDVTDEMIEEFFEPIDVELTFGDGGSGSNNGSKL